MADIEKNKNKNKEIERESSLAAMLSIVSLLCFSEILILLVNGNCADYFSREYSVNGFMSQFSPYMFIAIGTASFYFAAKRMLKLICKENNEEYKKIAMSISCVLYFYTFALMLMAQSNCAYYYSKELTFYSLARDYLPILLLLPGTFFLYSAIKKIIKLIASKNHA